ncbi:MAG: PBP1A family penicillin-binding protein [Thermaerobacterales bacterium]
MSNDRRSDKNSAGRKPAGGKKPGQTGTKRRRRIRPWRVALVVAILGVMLTAGAGVGLMANILSDIPAVSDLDSLQQATSSFIYDRHGNLITEIYGPENRVPVNIRDIPDHVVNAFIAIEDHRFYDHFGIDPEGIVRAAYNNITGGAFSGASTITQQLARNVFPIGRDVNMRRKLQEAVLAVQMERRFTKDEILEKYLNQINLGGHLRLGHNASGIEAAARVYFDKTVQDLTVAEAALLAGIPKSPSAYSPFSNADRAMARRDVVIHRMEELGYIDAATAAEALDEKLRLVELSPYGEYPYPHFVDYVINELLDHFADLYIEQGEERSQARDLAARMVYGGGLRVQTTLDPELQRFAEDEVMRIMDENFPVIESEDLAQAAAITLDTRDGQILSLVGGRRGREVQQGFNYATQATRQPGSAFKPLMVYGPALEQGWTAGTVIDDAPVAYDIPGQPTYLPRNYDRTFKGLITMREALRLSRNVPSIKTLHSLGIDAGIDFAQRLGISTLVTEMDRGSHDRVLSAALGGLTHGVKVLDMAQAYAVFGNEGIRNEPYAVTRVTDRFGNIWIEQRARQESVINPEVAYVITDMLRNVIYPHRIPTAGTASRWRLPDNRPAAGKTGTTNSWTDAWFVGYTPQMTTAVWMGYDKEQRTLKDLNGNNVVGGTYPAEIWHTIMSRAHEELPIEEFEQPRDIVRVRICAKAGLLPGPHCPDEFQYNEIFIRGTEPTELEEVFHTVEVCEEDENYLYESGCHCRPVERTFLDRSDIETTFRVNGRDVTFTVDDMNLMAPELTCRDHEQFKQGSAGLTVYEWHFEPLVIMDQIEGETTVLDIHSVDVDQTFLIPDLELEVEVPAGETVSVEIVWSRRGLFNFYFRHENGTLGPGRIVVNRR